jgi:hypothetical protein
MRHRAGGPEALRRKFKTFGKIAVVDGIADEMFDQAQGGLQVPLCIHPRAGKYLQEGTATLSGRPGNGQGAGGRLRAGADRLRWN